jgi:mono/diheme cytochrome c family protein
MEASMSRKAKLAAIPVAAMMLSAAAWYGGWATITVENLPDQLIAGEPYNLTFSIRQHGHDLLADLNPYVELKSKGGETRARAVATNKAGYYTATINVPEPGNWSANIESSFGRSNLKLMPIAAVTSGARAVSYSAAERGHRLFVAKGCAMCHTHAKVEGSGKIQVGPSLTDRRFDDEYLRAFLENPAIKPPSGNERMPKLNLNPSEIAALTAFIKGNSAARTAQKSN